MRRITPETQYRVCCAAFFCGIFAITCILTLLTPLIADDFNYAFSWADHNRVDNITLVIKSMTAHRQWTHGRVFAQGWVTLFMMWPKCFFSFANATVVTVFLAAAHHYFQRSEAGNPLLACLAVVELYWICMPTFGQVFLWLDGSCNYFWGAAFAWILIELEQSIRNRSDKWAWTIALLPLAFIAGAWSEHISFAMMMIQLLFFVRFWILEKKFPSFDFFALLASGLGYLFLMFAPSMLPTILKYRAVRAIGVHLWTLTSFLLSYWWIILLVVAVIIALCLWRRKVSNPRICWAAVCMAACVVSLILFLIFAVKIVKENSIYGLVSSTQTGFLFLLTCFLYVLRKAICCGASKSTIVEAVILSVGGISALALFALAMYIPARGFCAPVIFIGIATVRLWTAIKQKNRLAVRTALTGVFLICFVLGVMDIIQVSQAAHKRESAIEQALQTDGILMATPYPVKTKYSAQYGLMDLENGESWPNDIIQEYYGLKGIVVKQD